VFISHTSIAIPDFEHIKQAPCGACPHRCLTVKTQTPAWCSTATLLRPRNRVRRFQIDTFPSFTGLSQFWKILRAQGNSSALSYRQGVFKNHMFLIFLSCVSPASKQGLISCYTHWASRFSGTINQFAYFYVHRQICFRGSFN
jgi:hypothetical protein